MNTDEPLSMSDALSVDRDNELAMRGRDKQLNTDIKRFLSGEDDIEFEPTFAKQCEEAYDEWIKSVKIKLGSYDIMIPKKYTRAASEHLITLFELKKFNIVQMVQLLEAGGNPCTLISHKSYQSLLHAAVRKFIVRAIHYLIESGADVNALNTRHQTPLMLACDSKVPHAINVVRYLLNISGIKINLRDAGGNSALVNAIYKENPQIVRLLIHKGCRVLDEHHGPSGWEIAQFVFAAGMYLEPKHLPPYFVKPRGYKYKYFDMKGKFDKYWHVWYQQFFKYNAYLIYRMVQRQEEIESIETKIDNKPLYIEKTKEQIKDEVEERRTIRAKREAIERKHRKEDEDMKRWMELKRSTDAKIDKQFSKKIHMNLSDKTYIWKRDEFGEWYKHWEKQSIYTKTPTPNINYVTSNKRMAGYEIQVAEERGDLKPTDQDVTWHKDRNGNWVTQRGGFSEIGFIDAQSVWHKNQIKDMQRRKEEEEKIAAGDDLDSDDEEF